MIPPHTPHHRPDRIYPNKTPHRPQQPTHPLTYLGPLDDLRELEREAEEAAGLVLVRQMRLQVVHRRVLPVQLLLHVPGGVLVGMCGW